MKTGTTVGRVLCILVLVLEASSLLAPVNVPANVYVHYGWHPGGISSANGSVIGFENYQLARELRDTCRTSSDCRDDAYRCSEQGVCECANGYQPDSKGEICVGAIGSKCMYDSHCITRAYCKGQTTCTCKLEFPIVSRDKWTCEGSGAQPLTISFGARYHFVLLFAAAVIRIRNFFQFI